MSTIESVVWHVLGYSAMPVILLLGFVVTVGVGCFLLELAGKGGED